MRAYACVCVRMRGRHVCGHAYGRMEPRRLGHLSMGRCWCGRWRIRLPTVGFKRQLPPRHSLGSTCVQVSVSVVSVTARDFVVNVFRVDRHGPAWPDLGGRGWLRSLELDWLAWEPPVEDITVLAAGQSTAASVERDRYTVFCPDGCAPCVGSMLVGVCGCSCAELDIAGSIA